MQDTYDTQDAQSMQTISDPPLVMHWETIGSPAMIEMLYAEKKRAYGLDGMLAKHTDYDELKAAYDKYLVKGIALQRRKAITSAMNACYAAYLLSTTKDAQPNTQPDAQLTAQLTAQPDTAKVETDTAK